MKAEDFQAWRDRCGFTFDEAAAHLGIGRRSVARYAAGDWPVPLTVELACEAVENRQKKRRHKR